MTVKLCGENGNAFAVIGAVAKALKREVGRDAAEEWTAEAWKVGSYGALLQLCLRTVNVT